MAAVGQQTERGTGVSFHKRHSEQISFVGGEGAVVPAVPANVSHDAAIYVVIPQVNCKSKVNIS